MTAGPLALEIHAVVQPFLGSRASSVLESVSRGMLGVAYDGISQDKLGSLIYWVRIFVRNKQLIDEKQLVQMVGELEALRGARTEAIIRGQ